MNRRLSEVSFEKSCLNEKNNSDWFVGCAGFAAVNNLISHHLLRQVVRMQTQRSVAWFGSEDKDPMPLGEEIDTSPQGSREPGI